MNVGHMSLKNLIIESIMLLGGKKLNRMLDDKSIFDIVKNSNPWKLNLWHEEIYEENDIICKSHESYPFFYIIIEGKTNIYHTSEKGKTYSQSVYGAWSYFGELEIFDQKPFICEIRALTKVKLIKLPKDEFEKWISEDIRISNYLLKSLCETTYLLSKKAIEDTLYSLKFRICDYLISEFECADETISTFTMNKNLLSQRFVVTKRSINRILKELCDSGYIETSGEMIRIVNLKRLREVREKERF